MKLAFVQNLIVGALGFYILLTALFYLLSDSIIFQPPRNSSYIADKFAVSLKSSLGHEIAATYLPNPQAKFTILFSHGNAEDLASLRPFLNYLLHKGYAVFAYDYPGYSISTGKPTEAGTYAAIDAAFDYMLNVANIPQKNIILYGRSLGSGPTTELASKHKVAGVILEAPFVTAYRVQTHIPLILFDKFTNIKKTPKITSPTLVIHGTEDSIIPFWHGEAIFKSLNTEKYSYWIKGANHNDIISFAGENYMKNIIKFTEKLNK